MNSGTYTHKALDLTTTLIQQQGRHGNGVPVAVIFLTDGQSTYPGLTITAANRTHQLLPQVQQVRIYKQKNLLVSAE